VFFSGHSLINVNTPTFFAQLARSARHEVDYELQMGLGSTMSVRLACPRNGQRADGSEVDFDTLQTLRTGRFDTLVLTERNDIVSTILYERTTAMTRRYVEALRAGQPEARAFLFESWPAIEGRNYDAFRARVRREHVAWECVASRVNHRSEGEPMRVMPTGPAIADLLETITSGRAPGIQRPEQLFNDDVHLTNLGNYYVALLYYGVVFGRSPEGLTASALRPIAGEPPQLAPETVTFLQAHAARWARKTFEDEAGTRRSEGECIRELEVLCRATLGANAWGCTQVAGAYRDDRAEVPDIRDAWCRR
jgi:hypothetical protein